MPRRAKPKSNFFQDIDQEINLGKNHTSISDSDDEAANEDLSEKCKARAAVDGDNVDGEVVVAESVKKKKKVKKVKKIKKKKEKVLMEVDSEVIQLIPKTNEEELVDTPKDEVVVNLSESNDAENSNSENVVLRRLLRGPRYFDPPDKSWGACFNCGEEGHAAVNCTSARRKRPCFICGSLEHEVKQCQKGKDCFICKGQGHRAKDCPQKKNLGSLVSEFCLKCGASTHIMNTCNNDYSPDDLKDIQCYVCKRPGHLCCTDYSDVLASEASCCKCGHTGHNGQDCRGSRGETSAGGTPSSCFRCGEEGHFARECTNSSKDCRGLRGETSAGGSPSSCFKCGEEGHFARECTNSSKDCRGLRGETSAGGTSSSCFKCGEEGHFARECTNSSKAKKRTRDSSTPAGKKYRKDKNGNKEHKSAPQDFGKTRRKHLYLDDESPNWSSKPKQRGSWIQDDFGDLPPRNGWRSPTTPNNNHGIFDLTAGGYGSSPQFRNNSNYSPGSSSSRGYDASYEHRYTASRFGHPTHNNDTRRNYNWW